MHPPAGTGRAFREVGGTQDAGIAVDVGDQLALVPDMVPGGQDIDAAIIELAAKALCQATAARRIFGVDDNEVDGELTAQGREALLDRIPPGAPDHVAAEQDIHAISDRLARPEGRGGAAAAGRVALLRGPASQVAAAH